MTPRDLRPEMWRIIRRVGAQGRPFDVDKVRSQLRGAIRRERVRDYLKALQAGGYLVPCTVDDDGSPGWQLLRDPGAETPRVHADGTPIIQGAGREQCWRAMRILVSFDIVELVATASTDRWAVAPGEARDYCARLARAGILTRTRGGDCPAYTLPPARYTGPQPPQIRKSKEIYDPNTGRVYPPKRRAEDPT